RAPPSPTDAEIGDAEATWPAYAVASALPRWHPTALIPVLAVVREQRAGRGVLRRHGIRVAVDRRRYLQGQLLAELHAPLVERVDAPDGAFGEGDVLVQGDQLAQHAGRESRREDRRRRPIAAERACGHQRAGGAFCLDLFGRLAEGERLG